MEAEDVIQFYRWAHGLGAWQHPRTRRALPNAQQSSRLNWRENADAVNHPSIDLYLELPQNGPRLQLPSMASRPPFYVLVAHQNASQPPSSSNLRHPAIQYHHSDDSPLSLLPQHPDEHVLVLNYSDDAPPTAHSISEHLIVTGLRVEEAPGAAAASAEEGDERNDRMFIIEAMRDDRAPSPPQERKSASALLAQFKRRNQMIRDALRYPSDLNPTSVADLSTAVNASPHATG
ncbi:hypothetical protein NMY22_g16478 [Coprinellus aureogranulatus]|nr:hypothetical protein NMY22_g16478 [Coprinellus aureogranulatus]